jgi:WD40 repeat protein
MVHFSEWCTGCSLRPVLTLLIQAGISCKWTNDSQHLLLENFDAIHNSPSHLYHCSLPLSPSSSWLHKYYGAEFSQDSVVVIKGLQAGWGACSRTVVLESGPLALACWRDTIVVGLHSPHITVLDAIAGSQVAVLSGHTDWVRSLAFLSDGASLVSGSDDRSLKLWDMQTGGVVRTFHGHTNWVLSTSISSDCTTIASGSRDNTIRLWDIQMGECHCIISQQQSVDSVIFSPTDPQHLISVSGGIIWNWDINGHQIGPTYEGYHAALSLDGIHFVSSEGMAATVWDSSSGAIVTRCPMPDGGLDYCCFSPNGRLVAGAAGTTIYVWDITSSDPLLVKTFIGHTSYITSLTFSSSSSLISASYDKSVKFWQIDTLSTDPVASDPKSTPVALAPIRSITLQAKDGIAISSDSDGLVRTWDLLTGHCKASFQTPAKGFHCRDVQLVDGRLIFVWCANKKISIQDAEKGQLLRTVDASGLKALNIQISGDGSKVFRLDKECIQAWSIWTGEVVGKVYHGQTLQQDPHLTIDGSRVQIHSSYSATKWWDFGISGSPSRASPDRPRLDFIGGIREERTYLPGIEDTVTRKEVFQLPTRLVRPSASQWDGQYLVAGYESGDVLILDFNNVLLQ